MGLGKIIGISLVLVVLGLVVYSLVLVGQNMADINSLSGDLNIAYGIYIPLTLDEMQRAVDYCYAHATDENPIQDLVNAGLLPTEAQGFTCSQIQTEKNSIEMAQEGMKTLDELSKMK